MKRAGNHDHGEGNGAAEDDNVADVSMNAAVKWVMVNFYRPGNFIC